MHRLPRVRHILSVAAALEGKRELNEEESRKNFEAVRRVVVPGSEKSGCSCNPLAEDAGGDFFHSGGKPGLAERAEWRF